MQQAKIKPAPQVRHTKAPTAKGAIEEGFRGPPGDPKGEGEDCINGPLESPQTHNRRPGGRVLVVKHRHGIAQDNAKDGVRPQGGPG
jgi:hypothetical protein